MGERHDRELWTKLLGLFVKELSRILTVNQPEQMILVQSENKEEQLPAFPKEACRQYQCGHRVWGTCRSFNCK